MSAHQQHYHKCIVADCEESWTCFSASCDPYAACDACERRQFETYMDAHGYTVTQPELPECETTLARLLTAQKV